MKNLASMVDHLKEYYNKNQYNLSESIDFPKRELSDWIEELGLVLQGKGVNITRSFKESVLDLSIKTQRLKHASDEEIVAVINTMHEDFEDIRSEMKLHLMPIDETLHNKFQRYLDVIEMEYKVLKQKIEVRLYDLAQEYEEQKSKVNYMLDLLKTSTNNSKENFTEAWVRTTSSVKNHWNLSLSTN